MLRCTVPNNNDTHITKYAMWRQRPFISRYLPAIVVKWTKIAGHCGVTLTDSRPLWRQAAKNLPSKGYKIDQKKAMVVECAQKRNTDHRHKYDMMIDRLKTTSARIYHACDRISWLARHFRKVNNVVSPSLLQSKPCMPRTLTHVFRIIGRGGV